MFSCFKLNILESNYDYFIDKYYDVGTKFLEGQKTLVYKELDSYIDKKDSIGAIDGSKLQEDWFKNVPLDIFISHSHSDEKLAVSFAGWLYEEFGLSAFVDSKIWGYANDLMYKMNQRYNVIGETSSGTTYSHEGCNNVASHVHMMLSTSLNKIIDQCESVFFLNTKNSLVVYNKTEKTKSPWIYLEICLANTIRRTPPERFGDYLLHEEIRTKYAYAGEMLIEYTVDFDAFIDLNFSHLLNWSLKKKIFSHPLDSLYEISGILEKNSILK